MQTKSQPSRVYIAVRLTYPLKPSGGIMTESIGRIFWEQTKPAHVPESDQHNGLPQPPLELPYDPSSPLIQLSDFQTIEAPTANLWQVIEQRISLRRYSQEKLSLDELSLLLWATQGIKEITQRPVTLRTVPSAGARHAFETYLLINQVDSIQPGLYRYIAGEHALLGLEFAADINERITQACFNQRQITNSAVTFVWAAVLERMAWRYPERGYRYLLLDAGHVCQNLYLTAEALGCGVCAIAAYDDDALNTVLNLDGEQLFAIYAASLGKRATR
jgi:SagB-type dehydrogenase family enzyme